MCVQSRGPSLWPTFEPGSHAKEVAYPCSMAFKLLWFWELATLTARRSETERGAGGKRDNQNR